MRGACCVSVTVPTVVGLLLSKQHDGHEQACQQKRSRGPTFCHGRLS